MIFADMRWGVRDENTSDHKTWIECANGIAWCKEESAGVCFLSLQGDKYGYTPLPRTIIQERLDKHLQEKEIAEETLKLIYSWYILDENAVPNEYTLRTLHTKEESDAYWAAFPAMLSALTGIVFDADRYPGLLVGSSVTEWEVRAAFSAYPVDVRDRCVDMSENATDDAITSPVLWSHRKLVGAIGNRDFSDTEQDAAKTQRMADLIAFMQQQFPPSAIKTYAVPLTMSDLLSEPSQENEHQQKYLEEYKQFTSSSLKASLASIVALKKAWAKDGCGMNIPGSALAEILHHSDWAHKKCSTFVGREALIEQAVKLIQSPHRDAEFSGKYDGISVCLVGASGAGKTALMAKVAHEIYLLQQQQQNQSDSDSPIPVLIRFCGTSAGSRDSRSLMVSLCLQIEHIYHVAGTQQSKPNLLTKPYDEVVEYFQSLLQQYPVVLFVDSLDQLTDVDLGRSQISFMKGAKKLHEKTRVIVSCLPDEKEINPVTQRRYLYLCETRLIEGKVPRVDVQMSAESPLEEAMSMLDVMLKQRGRCVTATQRAAVQEKVAQETEKTALYLNLAVGMLVKSTSDVNIENELAGGVKPVILQLFHSLERDYGSTLVQGALAFVTYSVKGVSNVEMEDLLSLDDEVLDFVFQYNTPNVRRLPSHVWLRLRGALLGLVVEGEDGCMVWYHRQLKEIAEEYLAARKEKAHRLMAVYFGNIVDPEISLVRRLCKQELILSEHSAYERASVVNRRRCCEASKHMLQCGMGAEAVRELCSLESVCCRFRAGQGYEIIADLIYYTNHFKADAEREDQQRVTHYLRWLRSCANVLEKNVLSQFSFYATAQPLTSIVRAEALNLMSLFQSREIPVDVAYGHVLGSLADFDSNVATLVGHLSNVESVAYSPDGNFIVSGSEDATIRIWSIPF